MRAGKLALYVAALVAAGAPAFAQGRPCRLAGWITDSRWGCLDGEAEERPAARREAPRPSYRREEHRPQEAGGLVVNAILCGVSEAAWADRLREASTAAGGALRAGQVAQECPRSFGEIRATHGRFREGVTFAVYGPGAASIVGALCEAPSAAGCADMPGAVGVTKVQGNEWEWSTILHEIGHMRGLGHARDAGDIMYFQAGISRRVTGEFLRRLRARTGNAEMPPPVLMR